MTDVERQVITQAAHGELGAAIVQMIDSDDKIICDHVRTAKNILVKLLSDDIPKTCETRKTANEDTLLEACKHLFYAAHELESWTNRALLFAGYEFSTKRHRQSGGEMIEFHAVSLIVGAAFGAAVASLYHRLPKKRTRKKPRIWVAQVSLNGIRREELT